MGEGGGTGSLALCACLLVAGGCQPDDAAGRRPPGVIDAGLTAPTTPPTSGRDAAQATERDAGVDNEPDAGAVSTTVDSGVSRPGPAWTQPTTAPFSCAPLAGPFYFPQPGPDIAAAYARCASFGDARTPNLALSPRGDRAAMVGADGVVRVVDVASRTVVGVLAPPRASVGWAAFSPDGDAIVTVAGGEREVTLWRSDAFTPRWTTSLPGHLYDREASGAAAFSPDGATVLASPGADLFTLDANTGAITATRTSPAETIVASASYGWNGRRIALVESPQVGCGANPMGGTLELLDPGTLATVATLATWGRHDVPVPDDGAPPEIRVAAQADLLLVDGFEDGDRNPWAFRLSDGARLADPGFSQLPLAITPDGTEAVAAGGGLLTLVRIADGSVMASTPVSASIATPSYGYKPSPVVVSADGSSMAVGSQGADLLDVWTPAQGPLASICSAEPRAQDFPTVQASLSADGSRIAVDWGSEIRLLRRADGATLSTMTSGGDPVLALALSPDGEHVLGRFYDQPIPGGPTTFRQVAFRSSDGAAIAELATAPGDAESSWSSFVFDPDGQHLDGLLSMPLENQDDLFRFDLQTGEGVSIRTTPTPSLLVGLAGGCPLFLQFGAGVWLSCHSGDGALFATDQATGGATSLDGGRFLEQESLRGGGSATLWSLFPSPTIVRTYPSRPAEATWSPSESALAVSTHGDRVVTGAAVEASCYFGPRFQTQVHDVAGDTVIDALPPGPTSFDAELKAIAYGPVVWCAL